MSMHVLTALFYLISLISYRSKNSPSNVLNIVYVCGLRQWISIIIAVENSLCDFQVAASHQSTD